MYVSCGSRLIFVSELPSGVVGLRVLVDSQRCFVTEKGVRTVAVNEQFHNFDHVLESWIHTLDTKLMWLIVFVKHISSMDTE